MKKNKKKEKVPESENEEVSRWDSNISYLGNDSDIPVDWWSAGTGTVYTVFEDEFSEDQTGTDHSGILSLKASLKAPVETSSEGPILNREVFEKLIESNNFLAQQNLELTVYYRMKLDELNKSIENLNSEISKLREEVKLSGEIIDNQSKKVEIMTKEVKELNEARKRKIRIPKSWVQEFENILIDEEKEEEEE